MKSKISYSKFFLETWKKQLWVFVLSFIVLFLSGPIILLSAESGWKAAGYKQARTEALFYHFFYTHSSLEEPRYLPCLFLLGAIGIAVITAWIGFSYLHNSGSVDFYHSLPMRRSRLYVTQLLVAVGNYVIPAVVMLLIMAGIGVVRGQMTVRAMGAIASYFVVCFVFYMLNYALAALAMLLTGRILIALLGTGVFVVIGPVIGLIQMCFETIFYRTYRYRGARFYGKASPLLEAVHALMSMDGNGGWQMTLIAALVAAAILALCLFLYEKRPSEAAGRAMAFRLGGEAIKVVLTTVSALGAGLVFYGIQNSSSRGWLVFGLIFGWLLVYAVIQMLYHADIRRIFAGKVPLLLSLILAVGVMAFYWLDLSRFDTWLPDADKIESIGMDATAVSSYNSYWGNVSSDERLERMHLPAEDDVYALLAKLVEQANAYKAGEPIQEGGRTLTQDVIVRLKNGKSCYRQYTVRFSEVQDAYAKVLDRQEFKEQLYLLCQVKPENIGDISYMEMDTDRYQEIFSEKDPKRLELVEAIRQDVTDFGGEIAETTIPVGILQYDIDLSVLGIPFPWKFYYGEDTRTEISPYQWYQNILIYPSFTRTLDILKEMGVQLSPRPDIGQISEMVLCEANDAWDDVTETTITNREEIEAILPTLVYQPLRTLWQDYDWRQSVEVTLNQGSAAESTAYCNVLTPSGE